MAICNLGFTLLTVFKIAGRLRRSGRPSGKSGTAGRANGDLYWIYTGYILASHWIHTGFIPDLYWVYTGFILDAYWIYTGCYTATAPRWTPL